MAHKKVSKKATKKAVRPSFGFGGQEVLKKHNLKNDPRTGKFTAAGAKKQRKLVGVKSGWGKAAKVITGAALLAGGAYAANKYRVGLIKKAANMSFKQHRYFYKANSVAASKIYKGIRLGKTPREMYKVAGGYETSSYHSLKAMQNDLKALGRKKSVKRIGIKLSKYGGKI